MGAASGVSDRDGNKIIMENLKDPVKRKVSGVY